MTSRLASGAVSGALRARALFYGLITLAFALLLTAATVRYALSGGGFIGTVIVGGLTAGLWWRAAAWYRRFRAPPAL